MGSEVHSTPSAPPPATACKSYAEHEHGHPSRSSTPPSAEARSFTKRVLLLDQFVLKWLSSKNRTRDSHWTRSLACVAQDRGTHTVRELAASLSTSPRQLERRSLDLAGITPQAMARVARFVHALRLKRSSNRKRSITWTEIAHASGYYDQTHLIRDFRLMGGATPTALTPQLQSHHGASLLLHQAHNALISTVAFDAPIK